MLSLFVRNYLFVYLFIAGESAHDSGIPVYRLGPIGRLFHASGCQRCRFKLRMSESAHTFCNSRCSIDCVVCVQLCNVSRFNPVRLCEDTQHMRVVSTIV